MKLALNEAMIETKRQKRGGLILPFIAALVMIMIGDLVLMAFGISESTANPTMADNLAGLFVDCVPILLVMLYCRFVEKRTFFTLGLTGSNVLKNYGTGMLIGSGMIAMVFLLNLLLGGITVINDAGQANWLFVILAFIGYLPQGLSEERTSCWDLDQFIIFCRPSFNQSRCYGLELH